MIKRSGRVTEAEVRAVFGKHYSGGNLNEAMMASAEEMSLSLLAQQMAEDETLPDIVRTIARGKSQVYLFLGVAMMGQFTTVPSNYLTYFDELRDAMLNVVNYARNNYETMNEWFRERFLPEHLNMMAADLAEKIEIPSGLPANTRGLNVREVQLENDFFGSVLVGIIGVERFQRYAEDYNNCLKVLRQCQEECGILETMPTDNKAS